MHCPNCETEASVAQKFCRSCGFNLEKAPRLLDEKIPAGEPHQPSGKSARYLQDQQRGFELLLSTINRVTAAIIVIGVLVGIIFCIIMDDVLLPGTVLLEIICLTLVIRWLSDPLKIVLFGNLLQRSNSPLQSKETTKLSPQTHREPITSIAEHTTKSLEIYSTEDTGDHEGGDAR